MTRPALGKRSQFAADPQVDRLVSIVMSLATEVSVMRDRMDTIERLSERAGVFSRADVDDFVVDEATFTEREKRRAEYLDRVLWILREEIDQLAAK